VPVRHTKAVRNPTGFPHYNFRNPTGNLVFVVETDPRPTPYNSGIPRDSWLEYWLGYSSDGLTRRLHTLQMVWPDIRILFRWSDQASTYSSDGLARH